MLATEAPPVMEARRWIAGRQFTPERPLLNVSQAAPVAPPPEALRRAMAELVLDHPDVHLYGPVLGLPDLRAALADRWNGFYGGALRTDDVVITSGCNEAFAAAVSAVAGAGDEVILPTPWYFNHAMWLSMAGFRARPLPTGDGLMPDPQDAARLINDRTRAIVLVTPNNPGGVEYPADLIASFRDLARSHGLALIVDETYRDFLSTEGRPHDLFADPDWSDTVIQLYSFSKSYRLTGHRVGALVAGPQVVAEVEKFLDTVTICPAQLGQHAALWGIAHLDDWLAGERAEILRRRQAMIDGFAGRPGWDLLGCGAYFAYLRHPFRDASDVVARRMVDEAAILCLPGTMFVPDGDPLGPRTLRIAFANVDRAGIAELFARLAAVDLPRA